MMKLGISLITLTLLGGTSANAGLLAQWTFDGTYSDPILATGSNGSFDSTKLSATPSLDPAFATVTGPGSATATSSGSFNSDDLRFQATGTSGSNDNQRNSAAGSAINGSSIVLKLTPTASGTGPLLGSISLTYQARVGTAGDGTLVTWGYAVAPTSTANPLSLTYVAFAGTTANNITTTGLSAYSTGAGVPNFTGPNESLFIRATFSGADAAATVASLALEDVSVIPEPTNIALGVFGIGAIGIAAGRRVFSRKGVQAA